MVWIGLWSSTKNMKLNYKITIKINISMKAAGAVTKVSLGYYETHLPFLRIHQAVYPYMTRIVS